ncbi:MAG: IS3 family transposase [Acidimicrobiales bacterium]
MSRYRWVRARKAEGHNVRLACRALRIAPSSYYEWCARHGEGPSEADLNEAYLVNEIRDIHDTLDDAYGSPRLTSELAKRGFCANHKRIERLVRQNGLYAKDARRKRVRTTIPDVSAPPLPDLVQRDFSVGQPGQRTCGDITYIPTGEGWLYLADVEDLGSRRIVGYAMEDHMRSELVERALSMAIDTRGGEVTGMIFHHDRGGQYMSGDFRKLCERHEIRQSVGRTGSCLDNAVAESFWATLKREFVDRFRFESRSEAKRAIISWINHYNALRQHSSLNNLSPIEWELQFARRQLQAA